LIYEVTHLTSYRYSVPVDLAHHVLHLTPRATRNQTVRSNQILTAPPAARNTSHVDHFGNTVTLLVMGEPHSDFAVKARAEVDVLAPDLPAPDETPSVADVRLALKEGHGADAVEASEFTYPSPFVQLDKAAADYGAISFSADTKVLAGAIDLMHRIHHDFSYVPGSTAISTPVGDLMRARRGVCQDFAHVAVAAIRAQGLAARYVSGYIRTYARAGATFRGADASHAWFEIWCGDQGWIGLDPTNDLLVQDEHIILALGRDFGDVSPVTGIILGGGRQSLSVAVTVKPCAEEHCVQEAV